MSEEPHKSSPSPVPQHAPGGYKGSSPSSLAKRPIDWAEVRKVLSVAFAIVACAFAVYFRIIGDARAEVDGGVRQLSLRLDAGEARQRSTDDEVRQVKAEVKETQADIRSLYKAVMTGRRQERLEDAGSPRRRPGGVIRFAPVLFTP